MIIPNEILNLIFKYVEKNKVGLLFINPIIGWKRYVSHYCGENDALPFHSYYFSRYRTVYSKTTATIAFPLRK